MKCPVDSTTLSMTERAGIEIDYCPACRGVWLDRGELDKLIRGESEYEQKSRGHEYYEDEEGDEYRRHDDRRRDSHGGDSRRKRRGGFMENIFDGFGD